MTITVVYTAQLKAAIGKGTETIDVDSPCTLNDLLELLKQRHPETFPTYALNDDGQIQSAIVLCIGDDQVDTRANNPIKDGATVTFLAAISGG